MKDVRQIQSNSIKLLLGFILVSIFIIGCEEDSAGPSKGSYGPEFLVGCTGNSDGLVKGLYKMTNTASGPSFQLITELYPWAMYLKGADMNNGRIALKVDRDITPEGKSGVIFIDADNLTNINWVPIPTAPEKFYYVLGNYRPQVLPDGKIAYVVSLETDNGYDDSHSGMVAIYDPATDDLELTGNCTNFILAQAEQGSDTEAGSMSNIIASPDGKYIYCSVFGYGTDMGTYHEDYSFIVRYEVGKEMSYERIAQTSNKPTAITADGKYLILSGDGLHRIDLGSFVEEKVDDNSNVFNTGQISKSGSNMFKIWRGSGMGEWNMGTNPVSFSQIIQGDVINDNFQGLGHGGQYSADESKIYFTASTDYYTNYKTELKIFSTPIQELNADPDSVTTMPVEYCTGFFLLLK